MVEADRPVPLVAGDSRHRSNERSRYDQLWICRDPAIVFEHLEYKATTYGIALNWGVKFHRFGEMWEVHPS